MKRNLEAFILQNYKRAIDYHEIQAFYQPVIRTVSRQLCGFEALARWIDPELGKIYPDEFIPVLEREGLIHLLDTAILGQVCARLRSCIINGKMPVPVSVNLSRLDFQLCDIFTVSNNIVSDYQIPHDLICFEITESVVAEKKQDMLEIVNRFRSAGYQVWMDDFGSAYSSLNILKEFTFDEIKLDMSFLRPFHLRARQIVTAVVKMAKVIDIHTLAEGVETEEQFAYLRDIGCEKAQGYYFGRPMPYDEALSHLQEQGITVESLKDRYYYDEIGRIDYLSAVPFMTRKEVDAISTAGELNSIALALAEISGGSFRILFYNTAFEKTAADAGMPAGMLTQKMLGQPQPCRSLPPKIMDLVDSVRIEGDGRMLFTFNEQFYEIRARHMSSSQDKYCILLGLTNLTKDTQSEKTAYLDDNSRQIYAMFERITLLNYPQDSIRPLYTDTKEYLLPRRKGIKKLVEEYAQKYIYPEERAGFVRAFDPGPATDRLKKSGRISFSEVFRSSVRHGQYAWKEFTLLRIDDENYFMIIRNIHDIAKNFIARNAEKFHEGGPYSPEQLWNNMTRSELFRVFWKDRERRFLGASQGFLDFYDIPSQEEIIGKNDEEMGWHVHPDLFMNDEYKVIHEGATFLNVPGKCMSHGENVEILASKAPLYDINGQITGLIGFFIDRKTLSADDWKVLDSPHRDLLTGLLNSRGMREEMEAFQDEYHLRGTDFVRIHIGINDFDTINDQYGFDFGDKVLETFGKALRQKFGLKSAVGRYAGRKFAVLAQIDDQEDAKKLRASVKAIGDSVREIGGKPITLYLSVGYAFYSESLDLDEQTRSAEVRLHADYDQNISAENRIGHASELFYMFDDLPLPYAVFHVTYAENSGLYDAVFFYVNHKYEEFAGSDSRAMLGHTVRELFPFLDDDWYSDVRRAALGGEFVEGEFDNPINGKHFRFSLRQIIYPGYCAVTCVEMPLVKTRKHLLIVDDVEGIREMLGDLLSEDYDISYASDGEKALEMLRRHGKEIDLMILDLYMPKMTGLQVMEKMQEDQALKDFPVIVLTVDHDAELECLKMGALDFIPKPFPVIDVVKARIAKCISLSERHRLGS